jgi:thioester reductase-like protein
MKVLVTGADGFIGSHLTIRPKMEILTQEMVQLNEAGH